MRYVQYIKIASDSEYRYTVNCGISVRSSFIEGCSSLKIVCKITLTWWSCTHSPLSDCAFVQPPRSARTCHAILQPHSWLRWDGSPGTSDRDYFVLDCTRSDLRRSEIQNFPWGGGGGHTLRLPYLARFATASFSTSIANVGLPLTNPLLV